jgi:predicted nucleic acid-binding protein
VIGLIDSSGLVWLEREPVLARDLASHILEGTVAICDPVRIELLRGARTAAEYDGLADGLAGFPFVETTQRTFARARRIQRRLADRSGPRHRTVALADLLVAAAAIDAELPVLHRDRDFEAIAVVTGQPLRWLGPRP